MKGGFRHSSAPGVTHGTANAEQKGGSTPGKVGGFRHSGPVGADLVSPSKPVMSSAAITKKDCSGGATFRHANQVVTHGNSSESRDSGGNLYAYLGHFAGEKELNEGHNTSVYGARPEIKSRRLGAQAARQDVRFGSKLVSQARRSGGDVAQAKGLRDMAMEANQARKVENVAGRKTARMLRRTTKVSY